MCYCRQGAAAARAKSVGNCTTKWGHNRDGHEERMSPAQKKSPKRVATKLKGRRAKRARAIASFDLKFAPWAEDPDPPQV
jgi:hypothetical protein